MSTTLIALALVACTGEAAETPAVPALGVTLHEDALALTALAWEAIARSPAWLTDDLVVAFDRLDPNLQDDLALLIVDNDEPWTWDEVAFAIAHTSPEVLSAAWFHPQLLYAPDDALDDLQIVDVGEPVVDPDDHSVTTYRVGSESGEVVERTVDRETSWTSGSTR